MWIAIGSIESRPVAASAVQGTHMEEPVTLTLASVNRSSNQPVSERLSHDIRNTLATLALHLDTLERLSGPTGAKAASAAHVLVSKAAGICTEVLQDAANPDAPTRRSGFDIVTTIRQVIELLQPIAPEGFSFDIKAAVPVMVLGNAQEIFRVLFNLAHNAVMVARRTQRLSQLHFTVERSAATVVIAIADDGPGLPKEIRNNLFGRPVGRFATSANGFGLAIARELAERSGGTLEYNGGVGTTFTLVLTALTMRSVKDSPVTRMMGRAAIQI
jgi:signal transduction histidine kinase